MQSDWACSGRMRCSQERFSEERADAVNELPPALRVDNACESVWKLHHPSCFLVQVDCLVMIALEAALVTCHVLP